MNPQWMNELGQNFVEQTIIVDEVKIQVKVKLKDSDGDQDEELEHFIEQFGFADEYLPNNYTYKKFM